MAASDEIALGLVVNPKLKQPVLVSGDTDGTVSIFRLDRDGWPHIGQGYFGDADDEASRITGLPRSHTPDGVEPEGLGYGTCLYTALCLAAHQDWEKTEEGVSVPRYRIGRNVATGDGICSKEDDRSGSADRWWRQAKRLHLAVHQEDEQTDEDVDVTSEFDSQIEGSAYDGGRVERVNTISVDVVKTEEADAYPFTRATGHNLIAVDFTIDLDRRAPESLWKILSEPGTDIEVDVQLPWLLALDVRGLTIEAMNLIGVLAQIAGASEEQLLGLRYRWEANLDPEAEIRQQRLPFKPNSSEARAAHASVEEALAMREASGWGALTELP